MEAEAKAVVMVVEFFSTRVDGNSRRRQFSELKLDGRKNNAPYCNSCGQNDGYNLGHKDGWSQRWLLSWSQI